MPARVSSAAFVGRGAELATLESGLARVCTGRSTAVLLGGDAGMGKSRLVAEFEDRALAAGAEVLVGECVEMADGELPYGPLVAALRPLVAVSAQDEGPVPELAPGARAALARLWPELAQSASPPAVEFAQGQLFEAVHRLLAARAAHAPVALIVEDVHWADRSTRDLLTFLIRNSRGERILFVATYRSDEVNRRHPLYPFISELERSGRAERLTLAAFDARELREQLEGILAQAPDPRLVRRLLERSEGNPFFAEELLAAADQGTMPDSLRDALLTRVERLSEHARRTLELAAAVGRPASHQLLLAATDLGPVDLRDALREAADQRFLVPTEDGRGYAFRHALMREALYSDLLPGERVTLHSALGGALRSDPQLADYGRAAAELAHHWQVAGRPALALSASLEAAEQAGRVHAYAEAGRHLERVLELWERVPSDELAPGLDRNDVSWRAADAAASAGDYRRAIALARRLTTDSSSGGQDTDAGLTHARLARYLWMDGQGDAALEHYETALALVAPDTLVERARVLAAYAHVLMLLGRIRESAGPAHQALEIARTVGERLVEASVLNTLGPIRSEGELGREDLQLARAIAEELGAVEEIARSYVNECHLLEELGLLEESVAVAEEGIARAKELGTERSWGDYLATDLADRLWAVGRWEEAKRRAADVLAFTTDGLIAASAHTALGRIAAEQGDFEQAAEQVARSEELSARAGVMWVAPNRAILAVCALWAGDPDQAHAIVIDAVAEVGDSEVLLFTAPLYSVGLRAEADRGERARELGQVQAIRAAELQARSLLDRLHANGEREDPHSVLEYAAGAAELARLLGEHDAAAWTAVAADWDAASQPYRAAYARWRAADALVRSGARGDEAQALLALAAETAGRLAARPLLNEVVRLARRARLDLGPAAPGPDRRSAESDFGLTEREREVLVLLAAGRTNRQIGEELFITRKTASVHVSRILSKLGVANRAEAAGVAHTLGLGPGDSA